MAGTDNNQSGHESQPKIPKFLGPLFLVLGGIGLIGSWMITDPTVEKINMAVGAMIFFGIYGLILLAGVHKQLNQLQSQVDELTQTKNA